MMITYLHVIDVSLFIYWWFVVLHAFKFFPQLWLEHFIDSDWYLSHQVNCYHFTH